MDTPSRMERMVGELIGLRMLVARLVENEATRADGGISAEATRDAAVAAAQTFPISSDTPEGAERIRFCALTMLRAFPEPTNLP